MRQNLKLNTLGEKLIYNRMTWYAHILRMNEKRISNKVLNMKGKGSILEGDQYKDGISQERWHTDKKQTMGIN
jgi:hypothetical protein